MKNIVDSYYTTFLHRTADSAESVWLAALGGVPVPQLKLEDVGVSILTSAECLADITGGKL